MTLNQNQFVQKPVQGLLDLMQNFNTIPCQVDTSQVTALLPGQAVKVVNSVGGVPKVIAIAADTDDVFGFVNYALKNASYPALAPVEVSIGGNIMWMTAAGAITRMAKVNTLQASTKVQTDQGGGNTVVGRAFDEAVLNGDLIRVLIKTPV